MSIDNRYWMMSLMIENPRLWPLQSDFIISKCYQVHFQCYRFIVISSYLPETVSLVQTLAEFDPHPLLQHWSPRSSSFVHKRKPDPSCSQANEAEEWESLSCCHCEQELICRTQPDDESQQVTWNSFEEGSNVVSLRLPMEGHASAAKYSDWFGAESAP